MTDVRTGNQKHHTDNRQQHMQGPGILQPQSGNSRSTVVKLNVRPLNALLALRVKLRASLAGQVPLQRDRGGHTSLLARDAMT